jgi:hypothetical protein
MTGMIGRLNRTRRRSYPLKRIGRRNRRPIVTKDSEAEQRHGLVVTREYHRDPHWTEWTFVPSLPAPKDVDIVELLGRDNADPIIKHSP